MPTDSLHDLASNGTGFYAIWTRPNADYTLSLADSRISTAGSRAPYGHNLSVTWDGVNWRVLWGEYATTYIVRVNSSGCILYPGRVAVAGIQPGPLAGLGGTARAVWTAYANNNNDAFTANISAAGNRVLAQRLDAANPLTAEPVFLAAVPTMPNAGVPSVAWNGSLYLVGWGTTNGILAQRLTATDAKVDAAPFLVPAGHFTSAGGRGGHWRHLPGHVGQVRLLAAVH